VKIVDKFLITIVSRGKSRSKGNCW